VQKLIKFFGQCPVLSASIAFCLASSLVVTAAPVPVQNLQTTQLTIAEADASSEQVAAPAPHSGKVEAFALVGTASYDQKSFAFFDGNDSGFKQLLHKGEKIGGCTLVSIAYDHVTLKANEKLINVPVKTQLRRENEGDWKLLALTENFTPAQSPAEPEPASGATLATAVASGSKSAVKSASRSSAPSGGSRKSGSSGDFEGLSSKAIKKLESEFKSVMKVEKEIKTLTSVSSKTPKISDKRRR